MRLTDDSNSIQSNDVYFTADGKSGSKNLYALNPYCIGEPCPTQPKQVKTIPTIEVGKEGLAAFTVWINVNGFPSHKKKWTYVQMKDRSVECGLATYVQCEFRHPATKTQDPREVHDHDRNITGKDTNPFSEGRETQLYYGRGKTGVPGEKTAARA